MKLSPLITVILIFGMVAGCSSCKTNGPDAAVNERNAGLNAAGTAALKNAGSVLGSVLVNALLSKAQGEIGGSQTNADLAHSAAASVWSQVNSQNISTSIRDSVAAFSAGKLRQTAVEAQKAADAAVAKGKSTPEVANAVATVISVAAGAPPK